MGSILYFDYCALPIYLIIIYTIFVRKTTKGVSNVLFIFLTAFLTFTTVCDILAESYGGLLPMTERERIFFSISQFCYLLFRNLSGIIYVLFLITYTRTQYRFRDRRNLIIFFFPMAVMAVTLLTNPIHHKVYSVSTETGYSREPLIAVLYIVALFYAVFGTGYLIFCRRFMEIKKLTALISMYILTFIAVFWQFLHPGYLVEMYSSAIACLMITLLVLRPEEITDSNVGLPGWKAYRAELHKIVTVRNPVHIIVVRYLNAGKIRTYLGEEQYQGYVRKIAEGLIQFFHTYDRFFELYYEGPGTLYCVFAGEEYDIFPDLDRVNRLVREHTREYENYGVRMDPRVCSISYPGDLDNEADIIRLGHEFYGLIPLEQTFVRASELVGTRRYEIGARMDSILNRAITERGFEMYYQPIYSVRDESFTSAEALIRLKDDTYGAISPGLFIPAAESMGLILPIGDFVLDTVFRFISHNDIKSLGLEYIDINLSVAQCLQQNLPAKIRKLQEEYRIDPSQVNFEITETSYDDIGNLAERNIQELVEMGYSFSLDDYGTGYSNIRRVSRLPLKIIKIDKSLVDDMGTEYGGRIIRNAIRMMKDVDKMLVAEGVETAEDFYRLSELDCDYIQGYYFSKPLSEEQFLEFCRGQRK
ncbi:MAG: EAL domain-containing protein [Lachnospiraceae bacterium]|nr:EAL domain-containing protein [Lachnospiraceae bacterium]